MTVPWEYFTISYGPEIEAATVRFGRRDPAGPQYNCQTLGSGGEWVDSDKLQRYHLLGSNEDFLTDVTPGRAAELIRAAHEEAGRFESVPREPRQV